MFVEFSNALSLEVGRKRLTEADIAALVADSEEHITEAKGPMGFQPNEES